METMLKRPRIKIKRGVTKVYSTNTELSYKEQSRINCEDMKILTRNLGIYY